MHHLKGLKENLSHFLCQRLAEVERPRKVLYDPSVLHHQCNNMLTKRVHHDKKFRLKYPC